QLEQSVNTLDQARRRIRAYLRALGGDVDGVSLARVRSRLLVGLWKVGARACAPKHDHALARLTLRYLNGDLGAKQEAGRQFVCREPVLRGGAESKPYLQACNRKPARSIMNLLRYGKQRIVPVGAKGRLAEEHAQQKHQ